MRGFAASIGVSLLLFGCASTPPARSIAIDHMIIPAVAEAGGPVAAYAGFDNAGAPDRLLGIECACARSVELHRVVRDAGGGRMETVWPLALPTGRTEVKPPGIPLHFMLIDTNRPFVVGERAPMRLRFERAGTVEVSFEVTTNSQDGWAAWVRK